jgi:hypothetical protein
MIVLQGPKQLASHSQNMMCLTQNSFIILVIKLLAHPDVFNQYFSNLNSAQVDRGVWWRGKESACFRSGAESEDGGTPIMNTA